MLNMYVRILLIFCAASLSECWWKTVFGLPCVPKNFGQSSIVCVCNATYCDSLPSSLTVGQGRYELYQTTKAGDRFKRMENTFKRTAPPNFKADVTFKLNHNKTFQTVLGFGGAFTDSAGINIVSLSPKTQTQLLSAYYAPTGIEYSMGRIPIASCDFSTHEYSYDDYPGDFDLKNFSLAMEDVKFKIPIVQRAYQLSRRHINLYASPWSAPAWMKTDKKMNGRGSLIGNAGNNYHKTWANYFVRFFQEYKKHNITFWGMTVQNEPTDGEIPFFSFQAMGYSATAMRDFIAVDLGPTLTKNGFGDVKMMILDDNRILLPSWSKILYSNSSASKYISGAGVHWYLDEVAPAVLSLDPVHRDFPDKFILATEACEGSSILTPMSEKVLLGDWNRGENYAASIMEDLQHWVAGWMDWNIALDMSGGPNWAKNNVDSPIIVNSKRDEFYKQPMFYVMGHFSKFVPKDSLRIDVSSSSSDLDCVAFSTPSKTTVVVINNRSDKNRTFSLVDDVHGVITGMSPARSIQTYQWLS